MRSTSPSTKRFEPGRVLPAPRARLAQAFRTLARLGVAVHVLAWRYDVVCPPDWPAEVADAAGGATIEILEPDGLTLPAGDLSAVTAHLRFLDHAQPLDRLRQLLGC